MKHVEGYTAGENTAAHKNISTSDLIHFCGNWVWRAVEALVQAKDFNSNPGWIADRLNISAEAAKDALEGLERIGMLLKSDAGISSNTEAFSRSCNVLDRSDLFEIHNKMKVQIDSKITSRACFSNTVFLSNKQYIEEFYHKFSEIVEELNLKSKSDNECSEVFALELSLARLSREKA
jgi:DNA-binding Lrp family transcriptional regulator